jgi:hypothetical protein
MYRRSVGICFLHVTSAQQRLALQPQHNAPTTNWVRGDAWQEEDEEVQGDRERQEERRIKHGRNYERNERKKTKEEEKVEGMKKKGAYKETKRKERK